MDIMMPPLNQQVSPAPWLASRENVEIPRLIRAVLNTNPNATSEQVMAKLASWNVHPSGVIVSMWLMKLKAESGDQ
jgi:hypothetical protein